MVCVSYYRMAQRGIEYNLQRGMNGSMMEEVMVVIQMFFNVFLAFRRKLWNSIHTSEETQLRPHLHTNGFKENTKL